MDRVSILERMLYLRNGLRNHYAASIGRNWEEISNQKLLAIDISKLKPNY
jgi:hypothetical protein